MEYVPFEFCDSVVRVRLLTFAGYDKQKRFSSTAWQKAIDALFRDRISVQIMIGPDYEIGRVWSYEIWTKTCSSDYKRITFEKLQNLDHRNVRIGSIDVASTYGCQHHVHFEDITKLVKFALPFLKLIGLKVHKTKDFPQNELQDLLSLLRDSSVFHLDTGDNSEETWAALSVHLKSDSLKKLVIYDEEMSAEMKMKVAVKEYLLTKPFKYICVRSNAFLDMDLFKELFNKPQTEPRWMFECKLSIAVDELRDFEKDLQVASSVHEIEWKRQDGLVVEATDTARGWNRDRILFS